MPKTTRRIEESGSRLTLVSEVKRPLWQALLYAAAILPVALLLALALLMLVVGPVIGAVQARTPLAVINVVVSLAIFVVVAMGAFRLIRRLLPQKAAAVIDKGRGRIEGKKHLLSPTRASEVLLSELIGLGYVRTVLGEKRSEIRGLLVLILGFWGFLVGGRARKGRKLILLKGAGEGYESMVLLTVVGFLGEQEVAIARKIAEFLGTRAIVEGTVTSAGEALQALSGKDLGPEVKIQDFSPTS